MNLYPYGSAVCDGVKKGWKPSLGQEEQTTGTPSVNEGLFALILFHSAELKRH